MIIGGYKLHVLCDSKVEGEDLHVVAEFSGETKTKAYAAARRAGWTINERAGLAYCPACAKERYLAGLRKGLGLEKKR